MRTRIEKKAEVAFRTLLVYKSYSGSETENVETNIRTLLTDLMHLSDENYDFNLDELLQEARDEYNREKDEHDAEQATRVDQGRFLS